MFRDSGWFPFVLRKLPWLAGCALLLFLAFAMLGERGVLRVMDVSRQKDQMEEEIARGGTGECADLAFHEKLAEAAGNRALALVISTCSEVLNRTIAITQNMEGVPAQALGDHRRILGAVAARDSVAAEQDMREHLHNARRNLERSRSE